MLSPIMTVVILLLYGSGSRPICIQVQADFSLDPIIIASSFNTMHLQAGFCLHTP